MEEYAIIDTIRVLCFSKHHIVQWLCLFW